MAEEVDVPLSCRPETALSSKSRPLLYLPSGSPRGRRNMTRVTPFVIRQTDQALEKAIAFTQAKRAGEISYGRHGRSAGCIVTHPSFRERWLKVKWWAAGEMIRFAWDGEVLAVGLEGVSKPRLFGFFDWEAIGVFYRAMMMSVAPGFFVKGRVLDHEP